MRKPFLITLIITFIGAISWGMYVSKTNPLDYLFEIGVVLMGLGISILWQMKIFFLKPEHKKSFSNWRKNPDKKFVTLFMRDEQQMLPFIVPLVYLARSFLALGIFFVFVALFVNSPNEMKIVGTNLLLAGSFLLFLGVFGPIFISGGKCGRSKQEEERLAEWKMGPAFDLKLKINDRSIACYMTDLFCFFCLLSSSICLLIGFFRAAYLFSILLQGA